MDVLTAKEIAEEIHNTGNSTRSTDDLLEAAKIIASEYVKGLSLAVQYVESDVQDPIVLALLDATLANMAHLGGDVESVLRQEREVDTDSLLSDEFAAMESAVDALNNALISRIPMPEEAQGFAFESDDDFMRSIGIDPDSEYVEDPYSEWPDE